LLDAAGIIGCTEFKQWRLCQTHSETGLYLLLAFAMPTCALNANLLTQLLNSIKLTTAATTMCPFFKQAQQLTQESDTASKQNLSEYLKLALHYDNRVVS